MRLEYLHIATRAQSKSQSPRTELSLTPASTAIRLKSLETRVAIPLSWNNQEAAQSFSASASAPKQIAGTQARVPLRLHRNLYHPRKKEDQRRAKDDLLKAWMAANSAIPQSPTGEPGRSSPEIPTT